MKRGNSFSGKDLIDMFAAGSSWLEKSVPEINAINVFPVPDGDTGTNMLLTMRSVMEEADRTDDQGISGVAKAMAHGALLGARGNSGVILSQIFRGLAKGFEEKDVFNGADWAKALSQASQTAYEGLSHPVEGTILTVIKDAAAVADSVAKEDPDNLLKVLEAAVNEAKESVGRTPNLLPALMEAGVVDAGGQGLYILLDGALRFLKGEIEEMQIRKPQMVTANIPSASKNIPIVIEKEEPYGYCTNFLLEGTKLDPEKIRKKLEGKGLSLVVAGDETAVRVHIHSYDPGNILAYATTLGTLHQIQIQNMDDQHVGFMEMQQQKMPTTEIAVVAVVFGDGMVEVFKSLGAVIVPGGQTMNPSVKELLQVIDTIPSEKIIVLPNNKNIILTASQLPTLTSKEIAVVPSRTLPQGIASILAFNFEASLKDNTRFMEEALTCVKTVEITHAARSTQVNGIKIKEGQIIGIIDDSDLVAAGDNATEVLFKAIEMAGASNAEVVTIYYGADVQAVDASEIIKQIQGKYADKQVELVRGGQPHYMYIVSLE